MSNEVDLIQSVSVDTSWDDVVIEQMITDIPGGRSLDVSDLADDKDVVMAGHIILRDGQKYKALKTLASGKYSDPAALSPYEVVGVLYRTILKTEPFAPIMTRGVVNEAAVKNSGAPDYADLTTNVKPKEALPLIQFVTH